MRRTEATPEERAKLCTLNEIIQTDRHLSKISLSVSFFCQNPKKGAERPFVIRRGKYNNGTIYNFFFTVDSMEKSINRLLNIGVEMDKLNVLFKMFDVEASVDIRWDGIKAEFTIWETYYTEWNGRRSPSKRRVRKSREIAVIKRACHQMINAKQQLVQMEDELLAL